VIFQHNVNTATCFSRFICSFRKLYYNLLIEKSLFCELVCAMDNEAKRSDLKVFLINNVVNLKNYESGKGVYIETSDI